MKSGNMKTDKIDGVLIIDKPSGWTSHDVVAKIRNITKIKKVGHTGTLDPFATGVLPLALGRATRLTSYFLASDKVYRGVIRFGFATTTYDVDGKPLGEDKNTQLDFDRLQEIFAKYSGDIEQKPPPYSAKKIQGKPLYAYARQGIEIEAPAKAVRIKSLKLLQVNNAEAEFELSCSAGTYARSLAHDIGNDYGCGAHLIRLRRIRSGDFPLESAVPLSEGENFFSRDFFISRIIPVKNLLHDIPAIIISEGDKKKLLHGMELNLLTSEWNAKEYRLMDEAGELIAIADSIQNFTSPVAQPAQWIRIHPRLLFGV
jgi:tRNA pseudouridine55 synthase